MSKREKGANNKKITALLIEKRCLPGGIGDTALTWYLLLEIFDGVVVVSWKFGPYVLAWMQKRPPEHVDPPPVL